MPDTLIAALAGFATAAIPALVTWLSSRRTAANEERKTETNTDVSVAAAWREFLTPLRDEVNQLRDRVTHLQQRVYEQEKQLRTQRSQLEQQEQHEEKLRKKLAEVFDWIESGAVPPPPERPSWLK
ncbi:hypothetical protein [Canibacter oris]|uniref:Septal ring factor EnvC (AmiA/AmiB activator) n=1 Tax=Canibacter oris TaxID=1365628 RepID=A0A840DSD4_9MICO|nr:hypothetical protein [Canibacter oris]MBB4072036.1 septal ring factor EnvC (AmiA/AmiB activator) [Canibacter oris]